MIVPIDSLRSYLLVFVTLVGLTLATVAAAYLDLGMWRSIFVFVAAMINAALIAWVFMGVRHSSTLVKLFVAGCLVWLGIMLITTFTDYTTRHWDYRPAPWSQSKAVGGSH
jgi:cytochrome c oxidase subunit 4